MAVEEVERVAYETEVLGEAGCEGALEEGAVAYGCCEEDGGDGEPEFLREVVRAVGSGG